MTGIKYLASRAAHVQPKDRGKDRSSRPKRIPDFCVVWCCHMLSYIDFVTKERAAQCPRPNEIPLPWGGFILLLNPDTESQYFTFHL